MVQPPATLELKCACAAYLSGVGMRANGELVGVAPSDTEVVSKPVRRVPHHLARDEVRDRRRLRRQVLELQALQEAQGARGPLLQGLGRAEEPLREPLSPLLSRSVLLVDVGQRSRSGPAGETEQRIDPAAGDSESGGESAIGTAPPPSAWLCGAWGGPRGEPARAPPASRDIRQPARSHSPAYRGRGQLMLGHIGTQRSLLLRARTSHGS